MKLKRIEITKLCLVYTLVVVPPGLMAASTSVKKLDTKSAKEAELKWSSEFVATYASGLQKTDAVDYSSSADLEATLAATYNKTKYSLSAGASKALTGEREMQMNNAYLGAARKLHQFNDQFSASASASITIPLSEAAKDYQRQRTGLSVTPSMTWKSDFGLSLKYGVSAAFNLHKYETSLTGASNYQYNVGNALAATYELADSFYIFASATYTRLFTYQGNTKDNYKFLQLAGRSFDGFDLAIGHVMGGSPLAANGVETDVRFFDSRDSTIFGMLTVSF